MRAWSGIVAALVLASSLPVHASDELQRFPNARAARLLVFLSLLSAGNPPAIGSVADLDRKNGFRDLEFGAPYASVADLVGGRARGELRYFSRAGDSRRIGTAQLDTIDYGFDGQQLRRIVIYASAGDDNAAALLRAVEHAYGRGTPTGDSGYVWRGERVRMTWDRKADRARLVIGSVAHAG